MKIIKYIGTKNKGKIEVEYNPLGLLGKWLGIKPIRLTYFHTIVRYQDDNSLVWYYNDSMMIKEFGKIPKADKFIKKQLGL